MPEERYNAKPICPACAKKDAAFTLEQSHAVIAALDGHPYDIAKNVLARMALAFGFRADRFVWCISCAAFRETTHTHPNHSLGPNRF